MDARSIRLALAGTALAFLGASHRTPNFITKAPTPELAREVGDTAEELRRELAILWLGKAMPNWSRPCPITAQVAPNLGAGGATSFVFNQGEVYDWRMNIQGSRERILDSVLPHEVTHTIFASHFRRPLPRWADEGACTTVEHDSEREKQKKMLVHFLRTGRGISFSQMFAMRDYPPDVLPLYSQGYSLARYLIEQKGRQEFLEFLATGMANEQWSDALEQHYGIANLGELQTEWLAWVREGSPPLEEQADSDVVLASAEGQRRRPDPNIIYRAQSADGPTTDTDDKPLRSVDNTDDDETNLVPIRSQETAESPRGAGWYAVEADKDDVSERQPDRRSKAEPSSGQREEPQASRPRQVILEWTRGDSGASRQAPDSARRQDNGKGRAMFYDASVQDGQPIRR